MIEKLLKLVSDEKIAKEYAYRFEEDASADLFTQEQYDAVFSEIAKVEGVSELFRSILKKDRIRYFNAPEASQGQIKGAFMRMLWFLKNLKEIRTPKEEKVNHTSPKHI